MAWSTLISSLKKIDCQAQLFLNYYLSIPSKPNCIAFKGIMGAGKTTFIKAICRALGISDSVTSPTFALINEYTSKSGDKVYHFDFYRINKIEEAYDFGYEDYFYSSNICLIEWPEVVDSILPQKILFVEILVNTDLTRTINCFIRE